MEPNEPPAEPPQPVPTKACSKCTAVHPVTDYPITGRGYRRSACRACRNADVMAWRAKNPEKYREYQRIYARKYQPAWRARRDAAKLPPDASA